MKLKQLRLLLVTLCLCLAVPGCNKQESSATGRDGTAPKKKLKLAFVTNNASSFWVIARSGTAEAEKELGDVQVDFRIPSSGDAAEQTQILNDLMAKGVDGIAVSPKDAAKFIGIHFFSPVERMMLVRAARSSLRPPTAW